jgi:hypothetical protein
MTKQRWIIALAILIGLVVLVITLTSPNAFSENDSGRIDQFETSPYPRVELTSYEVPLRGGERWRIERVRTIVGSRQQLGYVRGSDQCGGMGGSVTRAHVRLIGGNSLIPDVITAHATMTWCYWRGEIHGSPDLNTWGDGRFLWEYQGRIDLTTGGGTNAAGIEYRYRRPYFKWTRGFQGVGQTQQAWIAMTVRGNGTCEYDKYEGGSGSC